jgi:L-malate glycosyltransferase
MTNKPKILFIGPMLGRHPGYVPNPMEILIPHLQDNGYTCLMTSSKINRYLRLIDIIITEICNRNRYDIACLQVFSGRSFIPEDISSWVTRKLGKRSIFVLHGGNMPNFINKYPKWVNKVIKRSDAIIAPSYYLAEALQKLNFNVEIIPNYFDIEKYPYTFKKCVKPRLLWMRAFHEIYNPEMAVKVLFELKKTEPDSTLSIAGQDKGSLESVRRLVVNLGLTQSVRFPGFLNLEEKIIEFSNHDIFLNTSKIDNMPISVLEAGAFGLPIVSTDIGGMTYLLKDGINAILTKTNGVNEMTRAIKRLLEDTSLVQQLSKNGRELAEKSSWEKIFPQWEEVIQKVARTV